MKSKKIALLTGIGLLVLGSCGVGVYAQQGPFWGPPPPSGPPMGLGDDGEDNTQPLPAPKVSITERDGVRIITSNGIPNHPTGQFPGQGNPNRIQAQNYKFHMPLKPALAQVTPISHDIFGMAVNGIPFDPGTAEFWNRNPAWNYEALSGNINLGTDASNAHVQPGGIYHYHGLPGGLIDKLNKKNQMVLVGYGADGFPTYATWGHTTADDANSDLKKLRSSYRLKQGTRPGGNAGPGGRYDGTFTADWEYVKGAGDLDECNGRTGVTPEYPKGTYYYVITEEFPYVPRLLHGKRDASFNTKPGPEGGPQGGTGGPGDPDGFGPPPPPGMGGPPPGGPPPGGVWFE